MTPPTPLTELADRVQALTCACRETGNEVLLACGWKVEDWGEGCSRGWINPDPDGEDYLDGDQPDPTGLLDAAVALVPEGHAFSVRRNCSQDGEIVYCNAQVWPYSTPREDVPHSWANSPEDAPAIALVAAILRARAASESSRG